MTEVRPDTLDYLPAMGTPGLLPIYDRFGALAGMSGAYWRLVAQAAIPAGATVLDIGCGTGEVALRAARAVPDALVTGVDPDEAGVQLARRKAAAQGLHARFERGYAQELPAADGSVDRVLSSLMFHHLPEDAKAPTLREIRRVLAPGGSLHMMDIDGDRPDWSGWLKPARSVFGLVQRVAARGTHAGHGQGHGQGHGHGHGHGHGPTHASAGTVLDRFAEAGLTGVEVGRADSRMGGLVFYRATAPAA